MISTEYKKIENNCNKKVVELPKYIMYLSRIVNKYENTKFFYNVGISMCYMTF